MERLLFPELSDKQVDILKALAHGHTNEYIGKRYGINVRTIEYHVSRIIERLGVPSGEVMRMSFNPRTRLAHLFYSRVIGAAAEASRGS